MTVFLDFFYFVRLCMTGIVQLVCWSAIVIFSFSIILYCKSGLALLCFLSRFLLRPYDVTIISNLLFVHSFMQFLLKCVCDVIFRS